MGVNVDSIHPAGIVPGECAARKSLSGRSWFVDGPPDMGDGACYGREVLCQCRKEETARLIVALLNANRKARGPAAGN